MYAIIHIPTGQYIYVCQYKNTIDINLDDYVKKDSFPDNYANMILGFYLGIQQEKPLHFVRIVSKSKTALKKIISQEDYLAHIALDIYNITEYSDLKQRQLPCKSEFEIVEVK